MKRVSSRFASPWLRQLRSGFAGLLFLAIGILAPARALAQDAMPTTRYYPLAVGTTWEYKASLNRYTIKVKEHKKVDGVLCAQLDMLVGGKVAATEYVQVTKDGVYRLSSAGKKTNPPIRFIQLPPNKGAKWKVDTTWKIDEAKKEQWQLRGEFELGRTEVKVGTRTYSNVLSVTGKDLEVTVQSDKGKEDRSFKMSVVYYFAEDVGMVKQELKIEDKTILIELEKYNPPTTNK